MTGERAAGERAAAEAAAWTAVDELQHEFADRWEVNRSEFPGGRRFVAKPLPLDGTSPWIIDADPGELRAGILLSEATRSPG